MAVLKRPLLILLLLVISESALLPHVLTPVKAAPGDIIWAKSKQIGTVDAAFGVAVDGTGLYVVGFNHKQGYYDEWRLEKRDLTAGNIIWSESERNSSGAGEAWAVAVDGTGVYIVGYSANATEWKIEKRNLTNGTLIWSRSEHINANATDAYGLRTMAIPYGVAVDGTGLLVVGFDQNGPNTASEWRIEKRDLVSGAFVVGFGSEGVISEPIGGPASGIAIDSTGIYIVGEGWRIEKRSLLSGAFVSEFGSGGAVSEGISAYGVSRVAVDSTGIYIAGGYSTNGSAGWRIEKRNLISGMLIGEFGPGGVASENMTTNDVAVDGTGIYIAGYDQNATTGDWRWRIEKRNLSTGSIIWSQSEKISKGNDGANAVAVYGGGVYVVGTDQNTTNYGDEWRIEKRDSGAPNITSISESSLSMTITATTPISQNGTNPFSMQVLVATATVMIVIVVAAVASRKRLSIGRK